MQRRQFIKITGASLLPLLVGCSLGSSDRTLDFSVEVVSDRKIGHLLMQSKGMPKGKSLKTKTVIVGGGVSGLAAAATLKDDFLLFEASKYLGGSSSAIDHDKNKLCQGAHYELAYPTYYGKEALDLLLKLDIIHFDEKLQLFNFRDKQYLINSRIESRTFENGDFRKELIKAGKLKDQFENLLALYDGKMPQPTRLISEELRFLNNITFADFIKENIKDVSDEFLREVGYHMIDDYGADAYKVNALAGIHYYCCRPYYTKPVELFSPPEGNHYFVKKLANSVFSQSICTEYVVQKIEPLDTGFLVEVINAEKKEIDLVECKQVIYAGHKHTLKYIFPEEYLGNELDQTAPWLVVNIVLKQGESFGDDVFWQNEMVTENPALLGFVNSKSQCGEEGQQVFTVYYCFLPEERKKLVSFETHQNEIVAQTLTYVESYFDASLDQKVEKVYLKLMGHAMPIPTKGYLFNDRNKDRKRKNFVFAGVDNGRLPLFFEALDSGIMAVKELDN